MHHLRRSAIGSAAVSALVCCALAAPNAQADTRSLHLGSVQTQFTSYACKEFAADGSCLLAQVTTAATATSNLATGPGSVQQTLIVDFSPGGSCNIVDEKSEFVFAMGTISTHSHHEDCATHGLRINTTFQVTGGTGAFHGATGSGREFTAATPPNSPAFPTINYEGTITF